MVMPAIVAVGSGIFTSGLHVPLGLDVFAYRVGILHFSTLEIYFF
jgi:hypothetical protein